MRTKKMAWVVSMGCLALISAACSGETASPGQSPAATEKGNQVKSPEMTKGPVELTFYAPNSTPANDEQFMVEFGQFIKKKYPNITFKTIYSAETKLGLAQTVAAGTKFDLVKISPVSSYEYVDLGVASDISDLVKKYNFNEGSVDPSSLQLMKGAAYGKLIGLPYQLSSFVMFYNKGIFDKFGLAYPKNGMTWDELAETVRKVTRVDGGVQYKGFASQQAWNNVLRGNQLSLDPLDPKTNKSTFGNEKWKQLFDQFLPIFKVAGNEYVSGSASATAFIKDQTMAMLLAYPDYYQQIPNTVNWDVVSSPTIKTLPGVNWQPVPIVLVPTANSAHRDEAFLVAMEMASREVQLERARNYAIASILTDPQMRKEIGAGIPELKGKNTEVMQPINMAAPITFTPYTADAVGNTVGIGKAFNDVMSGLKDTNTALREADEAVNKLIADRIALEGKK